MHRSGHFERIASSYDDSRPPYPSGLYDVLRAAGVIGPGTRVLEVGAGTGLATRELVASGSDVVALEPGPELGRLLRRDLPGVPVLTARLEDAELPAASYDAAAAATAMHWVDLDRGLPLLHAALRPGGWLVVWRTRFGDEEAEVTPFRQRVAAIVAARRDAAPLGDLRPTMAELGAGRLFVSVRDDTWRWSIDLDADRVRALFGTFSDWSAGEVEAAGRAVEDLGGIVTEHYRTELRLLRRA